MEHLLLINKVILYLTMLVSLTCFFSSHLPATSDKTITETNFKNELIERPKRQIDVDSKLQLDAQISYILAVLPFHIDLAEETIEKKVKFLVFNKLTWGWAVVIGGLLDFYSDFANQNRTLGNFGDISVWWGYGTTGFYAIGFGFPYILGLEEDNLPCHSTDFFETLEQYKLSNGLDNLFASNLQFSTIRAIVGEFDTWVRIKLACITDFEGNYLEAAEVLFLLDELNTAMNLRIDVEEKDGASSSFRKVAGIEDNLVEDEEEEYDDVDPPFHKFGGFNDLADLLNRP